MYQNGDDSSTNSANTSDPQDDTTDPVELDLDKSKEEAEQSEEMQALNGLKDAIPALDNLDGRVESRDGEKDAILTKLNERIARINELSGFERYLQQSIREIERTGGWWLIPDEEGAAGKMLEFRESLQQTASLLKNGRTMDVNITEQTTKEEALDIVRSLLEKTSTKKQKLERAFLDKVDATVLHKLDEIEGHYKKHAPHKLEAAKKQREEFEQRVKLMRKIMGKSKTERAKILRDAGMDISLKPSEAVKKLSNELTSARDSKVMLSILKAFLLTQGIKSGDSEKLAEAIDSTMEAVITDRRTKMARETDSERKRSLEVRIEALEQERRNLTPEVRESPEKLRSFIRRSSSVIFDKDEYEIEMSDAELRDIDIEENFTDDVQMRLRMLRAIGARSGAAEETAEEDERVKDLHPIKISERMREAQKKAGEIQGRLSKPIAKIRSRIEKEVKPKIETIFKDDPEGKKAQFLALGYDENGNRLKDKGVLHSLDQWGSLASVIGSGLSDKEGANLDALLDDEGNTSSLDDSELGIKDYLALAVHPKASQKTKDAALLTADDMLKKYEQQLNNPEEIVNSIEAYDSQIDAFLANVGDEINEKARYRIRFISLYDFKHIGEKVVEWAKRKYTRRSDRLIGEVGTELFTGLPGPLSTLSNEFDRVKEQSELDEVEQYKQSYSNKDAWEITAVMHKTRNQDEMKACMYLLADMGRIRWDDPQLWSQLMRFSQSAVKFNLSNPDAEVMHQGKLHTKLQRAIGVIWDYDTFQNWQSTNESNYRSKMESHTEFCHKTAEMPGGSIRVLTGMLEQYKKEKKQGKVPKVDPQLYEQMLHYDIKYGKGSGESKLYFLIQGIACGLLPRDVASRVNGEWINAYPVIDLFGSETEGGEKPTMDNIREWAELDGDINQPGGAFNNWFHSYVMHLPRVYQRVNKALPQGLAQDHDDATAWFGVMNAKTAETILSQNSQGFRMPPTGYQNATIGMLNYLDTLAENFDEMGTGESGGIAQLTRFATMYSVFDGITSGRMHKKRTDFYKFGDEKYTEPRIVDGYNSSYGRAKVDKSVDEGARKTQDLIDITKEYLIMLEPDYFDFLYNKAGNASSTEIQSFAEEMKGKYDNPNMFGAGGETPSTVEELHHDTSEFLRNLFNRGDGQKNIQKMIKKIKEDHRTMEGRMRQIDPNFKTIEQRKKEANQRWIKKQKSGVYQTGIAA